MTILAKSLNYLSQKLNVTLNDLQAANRKLELDIEHEKALEQARTNFFSAVSHELKTPITIIKGQLEGMLLGIGPYPYGAYCDVSLDAENKDDMVDFNIGDEVIVYYDGNIAESYPLQINTVYAISLKDPAN